MVVFPNAKINIGLHVVEKRQDNYHELETVFYPIELYDVLEVIEAKQTSFSASGISIGERPEANSCMDAYRLLSKLYRLPPLEIHLHKNIPIGAGLGGGSSDAAFMIKLLNEKFELKLSVQQMEQYAVSLGADCPFFIRNKPVFATGIGDVFGELMLDLSAYHFVIVKPAIHISTAEAYQSILPQKNGKLYTHIMNPIDRWKKEISNDFERGIVETHKEIREIKEYLYQTGAEYASMSGSGSAVFGIFKEKVTLPDLAEKHMVFYC